MILNPALRKIVREAVKHFRENGYTSSAELMQWQMRIREAAELVNESALINQVTTRLEKAYMLDVDRHKILRRHAGISRFQIDNIRPRLRAELDRRIMASADLIKLNRTKAIETTLSRFSGWATSIPDEKWVSGAPQQLDLFKTVYHITKTSEQIRYEANRVMIDQNHKLLANIDNIVATDNGAIAAIWHSHWRQPGYDYRDKHKARDLLEYAIRGSWAIKAGYMKKGDNGYLDEITQPGQEVFCRCFVTYIYNLRSVPAHMLTKKGREFLDGKKQRRAT